MLVKRNASSRTLVVFLIILACIDVTFVFIFFAFLLNDLVHNWQLNIKYYPSTAITDVLTIIMFPVVSAIMFYLMIGEIRKNRYIDQMRQETARTLDKQIALDELFSTRQPHVIVEPFLVKLRPRARAAFITISVISIPTVPLSFLFGIQPKHVGLWQSELGTICILIGIFTLTWFITRERLWVSKEGMGITHWGRKHFIRWHDARLFTVTHSDPKSFTLELASEKTIVRWFVFTAPPESVNYIIDLPFDEYQRKMDGLLLLISERTGLPLMDLRDVEEG